MDIEGKIKNKHEEIDKITKKNFDEFLDQFEHKQFEAWSNHQNPIYKNTSKFGQNSVFNTELCLRPAIILDGKVIGTCSFFSNNSRNSLKIKNKEKFFKTYGINTIKLRKKINLSKPIIYKDGKIFQPKNFTAYPLEAKLKEVK
jgi:hypothetical protein